MSIFDAIYTFKRVFESFTQNNPAVLEITLSHTAYNELASKAVLQANYAAQMGVEGLTVYGIKFKKGDK